MKRRKKKDGSEEQTRNDCVEGGLKEEEVTKEEGNCSREERSERIKRGKEGNVGTKKEKGGRGRWVADGY